MKTELSYPTKFDADYVPPKAKDFIFDYSFVEGEIFFVSSQGWKGVSFFGKSTKHHPGCVVIKQKRPRRPVTVVPGTSQPQSGEDNFYPDFPLWHASEKVESKSDSAFLYLYATPVSRRHFVRFFGAMENRDVLRLLRLITDARGPIWRNDHG